MSLYKHPITGQWEQAEWLDDYFGHSSGIRFKDGYVMAEPIKPTIDDNSFLPESELEIKLTNILNEFRRNVKEAKVMGGQAYAHAQIAQLLAQEYARGHEQGQDDARLNYLSKFNNRKDK